MANFYLIKEEGALQETFAIVIERTRTPETLKAIKTAISDYFECDCTPGCIDLDIISIGNPQILHVTAGRKSCNIEVSIAPLY